MLELVVIVGPLVTDEIVKEDRELWRRRPPDRRAERLGLVIVRRRIPSVQCVELGVQGVGPVVMNTKTGILERNRVGIEEGVRVVVVLDALDGLAADVRHEFADVEP